MRATIRRGSPVSEDVRAWQRIVGVAADGVFGKQTEAATIDWQRAHKLVADGVVGPATWSMAELGGSGPSAPPSSPAADVGFNSGTGTPTPHQSVDVEAYRVSLAASPNLSEALRQYAVTVGRGEGFFGRGWATPSAITIELSKRFGLTGYEGKGSNNWGAEQGQGNAGSFPHVDRHRDGTPYVAQYKRHATPEDGFRAFARTLYGGGRRGAKGAEEIRAAVERGDLKAAVDAQHANGYFELDPSKYLAAVTRNYAALTANVGSRPALGVVSEVAAVGAKAGVGGLALAALAGLGWAAFKLFGSK